MDFKQVKQFVARKRPHLKLASYKLASYNSKS